MSDRVLIALGVALALANLYISWRLAMAMADLKAGADKTISDVKSGPFGPVLGFLGLK